MKGVLSFVFFFSSRRRHTRSLCDWSSDVCSSDLLCQPSKVCLRRWAKEQRNGSTSTDTGRNVLHSAIESSTAAQASSSCAPAENLTPLCFCSGSFIACADAEPPVAGVGGDRKSTRLNSRHTVISYAVFC